MTEKSTIDPAEVARFAALAEKWWNPSGPLAPLHRLNPLRVIYLKDTICRKFGRDWKDPRALAGLTIIDVGCGGGLVTEPLCRMGATVTGIDPAAESIAVAAHHAKEAGLAVEYRAVTIEAQAALPGRFDVVTLLEVVEHVTDMPAFVAAAASLLKPGGLIIAATINRTLKAWLLAIVGAEYVLRWLARGTHRYDKLVTPAELTAALRAAGLSVIAETGVMYVPIADRWRLSRDMDVNYMMVAERQVGIN
jgi:2-polyprenyl-6-hydroxyphenyl methylase/3-demethylubiquinone-9 3-methyltransferase